VGRAVGRPRTPQLNSERIGAAALELVDADGNFTMPGLAQRLGVQVSSIYHHAPGRAAVVELVRDRVTSDIDGSWFDTLPWDQAIDAWARNYLSAFRKHPAAIRLLATETISAPHSIAVFTAAASSLYRAGFPDNEILAVITAVESFILGAALDAVAPATMITVSEAEGTETLRLALAAAPSGPARAQQAFDVGLAALVEGLRTLLLDHTESSGP
jgi:AcrR family transcriptional regulator